MPGHNRSHYRGDYARRAAIVRRNANANPLTRCWRCGQLAQPGQPWQAGHLRDSDPTSPLLPEHRRCNAAAGGRLGGVLRRERSFSTSRRW